MNTSRVTPRQTERRIRRILLPTDLKAGGEAALALAATLARQLWAKLHVLHVETPFTAEEPASRLAKLARIADDHPEVPIVALSRPGGTPSAAILEYAADNDVDLIVMAATRLHQGFGHLLGSVAREVVDGSDRPVLTVRSGDAATEQLLVRVLVPVDFSTATADALDLAAEIAHGVKGELILLHLIAELGRGRARLRAEAEAKLRAIAATLAPPVSTSIEVRAGSPVDEIVRCSAAMGADLIVIASHASAGRRMWSGSVAEEVQRFAASPVLLVKGPSTAEQRAAG